MDTGTINTRKGRETLFISSNYSNYGNVAFCFKSMRLIGLQFLYNYSVWSQAAKGCVLEQGRYFQRLTEFLVREGLGSDSGAEVEEVGAGVEVEVQEIGGGKWGLENHLQVAKHQSIQGSGAAKHTPHISKNSNINTMYSHRE